MILHEIFHHVHKCHLLIQRVDLRNDLLRIDCRHIEAAAFLLSLRFPKSLGGLLSVASSLFVITIILFIFNFCIVILIFIILAYYEVGILPNPSLLEPITLLLGSNRRSFESF